MKGNTNPNNKGNFEPEFKRRVKGEGFLNFKFFDEFIQNSLDRFKFVDPMPSLYEATGSDANFVISHKSTIPDLVIWNKTFNKNECFEGADESKNNPFPRFQFYLRVKAIKTNADPKDKKKKDKKAKDKNKDKEPPQKEKKKEVGTQGKTVPIPSAKGTSANAPSKPNDDNKNAFQQQVPPKKTNNLKDQLFEEEEATNSNKKELTNAFNDLNINDIQTQTQTKDSTTPVQSQIKYDFDLSNQLIDSDKANQFQMGQQEEQEDFAEHNNMNFNPFANNDQGQKQQKDDKDFLKQSVGEENKFYDDYDKMFIQSSNNQNNQEEDINFNLMLNPNDPNNIDFNNMKPNDILAPPVNFQQEKPQKKKKEKKPKKSKNDLNQRDQQMGGQNFMPNYFTQGHGQFQQQGFFDQQQMAQNQFYPGGMNMNFYQQQQQIQAQKDFLLNLVAKYFDRSGWLVLNSDGIITLRLTSFDLFQFLQEKIKQNLNIAMIAITGVDSNIMFNGEQLYYILSNTLPIIIPAKQQMYQMETGKKKKKSGFPGNNNNNMNMGMGNMNQNMNPGLGGGMGSSMNSNMNFSQDPRNQQGNNYNIHLQYIANDINFNNYPFPNNDQGQHPQPQKKKSNQSPFGVIGGEDQLIQGQDDFSPFMNNMNNPGANMKSMPSDGFDNFDNFNNLQNNFNNMERSQKKKNSKAKQQQQQQQFNENAFNNININNIHNDGEL